MANLKAFLELELGRGLILMSPISEITYHDFDFTSTWLGKPIYWGMVLVQVQKFGTGTRFCLDVLQ